MCCTFTLTTRAGSEKIMIGFTKLARSSPFEARRGRHCCRQVFLPDHETEDAVAQVVTFPSQYQVSRPKRPYEGEELSRVQYSRVESGSRSQLFLITLTSLEVWRPYIYQRNCHYRSLVVLLGQASPRAVGRKVLSHPTPIRSCILYLVGTPCSSFVCLFHFSNWLIAIYQDGIPAKEDAARKPHPS